MESNVTGTVTPSADSTSNPTGVKVGLVTKKGKTRGKNPREIEYKAFDTSVPASLPKTMKEFMEVTGVSKLEEILEYTINGFNDAQYSAASDEIGEYIPDEWPGEIAAQFRLAVRNTAKMTGLEIENVVNMLKPAVVASLAKKAQELNSQAAPVSQPVTA